MRYEYDIFVSYKRYGEWTKWVCGEFRTLLHDHLGFELGDEPKIFVDDQMESGTDWPNDLAQKLTVSRVTVPLFSKMYFGSSWCLRELYATRFKEGQLGLRTRRQPAGIIVPGRIHDGTKVDLPSHLQECCRLQAIDLTKFALTSLQRTSPIFIDFETTIKDWIRTSIVPAIQRTHNHNPDNRWLERISTSRFRCPAPAYFRDPTLPSLA